MSTRRLLYVAHDHLHEEHGILKAADPQHDVVILVESQRMLTGRPWHKERLFFLTSSARHFAQSLEVRGFTVRYIRATTTVDGLRLAQQEFGPHPIYSAQPSSHRQTAQLTEFGVQFVDNDFFLTSRTLFASWASQQRQFVMENFYRAQRVRLNLLMDGSKPEGGRWNFDADNRLPPPKHHEWPPYLAHERDALDLEVAEQLDYQPTTTWATSRAGALAQLQYFIEHHLPSFGPYEDAIADDNWAMHHSLLSPYLNNGLLHPAEAVAAVVAAYRDGKAPINSVEAFVRQVIGWREYINGMYWFLGEEYRNSNALNADRPLLPLFQDPSKTRMQCVSSVVRDVQARAWAHHIPRLMVLSNLALTTGTNPQEFLDWMREQFIDAADWVMVPNVIGMATHADGGRLMTKPYASGGAYLQRMTNFCTACPYNPKKRTGDDACPFTTLYWDFLDRHQEAFAGNHRMAQQLHGVRRLADMPEVRARAVEVLDGLARGTI